MKLHAYAKLNLSLHVVSSRPDGFHDIDSCVQTIDLHDTLTVKEEGTRVLIENDASIPRSDDLIMKAAGRILAEKKSGKGLHIKVKKQIPIGAGLGGGSSDAAAVLWAIDRLTPPLLPLNKLKLLAVALGADVPLFLTGGRMAIHGRGDVVFPSSTHSQDTYLLLIPPIRCSTASVYACFDQMRKISPTAAEHKLGENDLEKAALKMYPTLIRYRDAVRRLKATYAGMTGSGATFYAAFTDPDVAIIAKDELAKTFSEARLCLCHTTESGFRVVEETKDADCH